jgi:hypothetical protein
MLVARRDPPFEAVAHDASVAPAHSAPHASHGSHASHSSRFMTALQVAGSLLAIPLGLASGYSIYHSNFSAEAQCQSLRANIISMLDKNADASTLRMLVRRDAMAFEKSCGAVDPDAVAAFKSLLTSTRRAAAPMRQVAPEPVRKTADAPKTVVAQPVTAKVEKPARKNETVSDAKWLDAVRGALIHTPETAEPAKAVAARVPAPPQRPLGELRAPLRLQTPAVESAAEPPTASISQAPKPAAEGHPVPPAAIPEPTPQQLAAAAPAAKPARSGIAGLIADIPLLGRMVGH